jgi:hypothetical protein
MTPEAPTAELFAGLGLSQRRLAKILGSTPRHVRRWRRAERRVPHGIGIVLRLLADHIVTIDQVEQAARLNGHADPEPPEQPAPAELTVAEKVYALPKNGCRFAVGDPQKPEAFDFCRASIERGRYCARHYALSTIARLPRIVWAPKPRSVILHATPELVPADPEFVPAVSYETVAIELVE